MLNIATVATFHRKWLFYTDFSFSLSSSFLNIVRIVNLTELIISRQPQSTGHGHSRGFHRDGTQSTSSGRGFTVSTFFTGLSFRQHYFDGKFVRNIVYSLYFAFLPGIRIEERRQIARITSVFATRLTTIFFYFSVQWYELQEELRFRSIRLLHLRQ